MGGGIRPDFQDTCHFKNQSPKSKSGALGAVLHGTHAASTASLDCFPWDPAHSRSVHIPLLWRRPPLVSLATCSNWSPSFRTLASLDFSQQYSPVLVLPSVPKYSYE